MTSYCRLLSSAAAGWLHLNQNILHKPALVSRMGIRLAIMQNDPK